LLGSSTSPAEHADIRRDSPSGHPDFARARRVGRRLALSALIVGIASPLFFLVVAGNQLTPEASLQSDQRFPQVVSGGATC